MNEETPPGPSTPDGQSSKQAAKRITLSAVIVVFLAVLGFMSSLPGLKSWADGIVQGQVASWLLLGVILAAVLGASWLILWVGKTAQTMGPDRLWHALAWMLVIVFLAIIVLWGALAGFETSNALVKRTTGPGSAGPPPSTPVATGQANPSPTSLSPTPATQSNSPASRPGQVIFADNFCTTTTGGWTTGSGQAGGHYSSCALLVYANANDVDSSEPRAGAVYPSAPAGIEIDVTARRIAGSAEGDEFGLACRADGEGYAFIVQSDLVKIIKYSSTTGAIGSPLADVPARINMNAPNRLQATCGDSGTGVYLALRVSGKKLVDATDASDPIPGGTVGVFAATTSAQTPTEAEFEDFEVIAPPP